MSNKATMTIESELTGVDIAADVARKARARQVLIDTSSVAPGWISIFTAAVSAGGGVLIGASFGEIGGAAKWAALALGVGAGLGFHASFVSWRTRRRLDAALVLLDLDR